MGVAAETIQKVYRRHAARLSARARAACMAQRAYRSRMLNRGEQAAGSEIERVKSGDAISTASASSTPMTRKPYTLQDIAGSEISRVKPGDAFSVASCNSSPMAWKPRILSDNDGLEVIRVRPG